MPIQEGAEQSPNSLSFGENILIEVAGFDLLPLDRPQDILENCCSMYTAHSLGWSVEHLHV